MQCGAMRVYRNLIADNWFESDSGSQFQDRNPADERELKVFFLGVMPEDTNHIVSVVSEICPEWKPPPPLGWFEIFFWTISSLTLTLRELELIK